MVGFLTSNILLDGRNVLAADAEREVPALPAEQDGIAAKLVRKMRRGAFDLFGEVGNGQGHRHLHKKMHMVLGAVEGEDLAPQALRIAKDGPVHLTLEDGSEVWLPLTGSPD